MELTQEQIDIEIQIGLKQTEIEKLENWFDNFFQKQLIQSMWQSNFQLSKDNYFLDDNGEPLIYESIDELKEKGEEIRTQIKTLRAEIKDLNLKAEELAILQRDTKPEEFAEYNEYVEQCKEQVKTLDIVDKVDCEENIDTIEETSNTEANV